MRLSVKIRKAVAPPSDPLAPVAPGADPAQAPAEERNTSVEVTFAAGTFVQTRGLIARGLAVKADGRVVFVDTMRGVFIIGPEGVMTQAMTPLDTSDDQLKGPTLSRGLVSASEQLHDASCILRGLSGALAAPEDDGSANAESAETENPEPNAMEATA